MYIECRSSKQIVGHPHRSSLAYSLSHSVNIHLLSAYYMLGNVCKAAEYSK